jgi:hypothetical protein
MGEKAMSIGLIIQWRQEASERISIDERRLFVSHWTSLRHFMAGVCVRRAPAPFDLG